MRPETLSVLVVDDDPLVRRVCRTYLESDSATRYEIEEVGSGREALARCRARRFGCVVLDYHLPDLSGLEVLSALVSDPHDVEIPVVMLTGAGSEAVAVETMKRGSQDYVTKSSVSASTLLQAVHNAVEKVALRRELKAQQEALERSRRQELELRDQFLSHVSHELRTPLAAIHQFVTLVRDGVSGDLNDVQREYLGIAARNVDQLKRMMGDLLEAVRAQSGKLAVEPRRLALAGLLRETLAPLEREAEVHRIAIHREIDPELPGVSADPERVAQIVGNLVGNALKFTPEQGCIEVAARRDPEARGFVRISVVDTGCGIDEAVVARVFDRLYQAGGEERQSRTGLGLGLSICKELVALQGGRIWVESKLGAGSTFHFTLPVFSLATIVRPAILDGDTLRGCCALVQAQLVGEPAGRRVAESESREFHRALASFVYYPQLDVLLPRLLPEGRPDRHFVLAATDARGLEAMLARLRKHLGRVEGQRLHARFDGRILHLPQRQGQEPLEAALERAAAEIETIVLETKGG